MFGRKRNNLSISEQKDIEFIKSENAELKATLETLTARFNQVSENVIEVEKKDDSEMPTGDYLNPIKYEQGMRVTVNLFYYDADKDMPLMAVKNGYPTSFGDSYFEVLQWYTKGKINIVAQRHSTKSM